MKKIVHYIKCSIAKETCPNQFVQCCACCDFNDKCDAVCHNSIDECKLASIQPVMIDANVETND